MNTPMTNRYGAESRAAPWYGIPAHSLVSVEHPCIVKDVDKAIDMLDGGGQISKVSLHDTQTRFSRRRILKWKRRGRS